MASICDQHSNWVGWGCTHTHVTSREDPNGQGSNRSTGQGALQADPWRYQVQRKVYDRESIQIRDWHVGCYGCVKYDVGQIRFCREHINSACNGLFCFQTMNCVSVEATNSGLQLCMDFKGFPDGPIVASIKFQELKGNNHWSTMVCQCNEIQVVFVVLYLSFNH